jgi:hypothetical protein
MMVARHGMPGKCYPAARPVGYGMIGWREAAIVSYGGQTQIAPSLRNGFLRDAFQAFHAWLPPFRPSRTKIRSTNLLHLRTSALICGCSVSAVHPRFGTLRTRQNPFPEQPSDLLQHGMIPRSTCSHGGGFVRLDRGRHIIPWRSETRYHCDLE